MYASIDKGKTGVARLLAHQKMTAHQFDLHKVRIYCVAVPE